MKELEKYALVAERKRDCPVAGSLLKLLQPLKLGQVEARSPQPSGSTSHEGWGPKT